MGCRPGIHGGPGCTCSHPRCRQCRADLSDARADAGICEACQPFLCCDGIRQHAPDCDNAPDLDDCAPGCEGMTL